MLPAWLMAEAPMLGGLTLTNDERSRLCPGVDVPILIFERGPQEETAGHAFQASFPLEAELQFGDEQVAIATGRRTVG